MKNTQKGFVAILILVIIVVLVIGAGVYVYTNRNVGGPTSENQNKQTVASSGSCQDFATLSGFVLQNIQKPDSQKTMQMNPNVITSFHWKRNATEPFVSYPIINGIEAYYGNEKVNHSIDFTVSTIKKDSDALNQVINTEAKSLDLTVNSLNTLPFQSFSNQDVTQTFGFEKDGSLYSIALTVDSGDHQAPPQGVVRITCGKAPDNYDKVYNALNLKVNSSTKDSYNNDYVAISDISSDKTVYAVLGSSNQVKLANYYYFDGKTAKLVSDDSYPANCLTLESQKVGQGMRCADNLNGTQRTVNYGTQSAKSYSNSQYGFQFTYPQDFSIEERTGTPFSFSLRDANNTFPVQMLVGNSNDPKIAGLLNPQNDQFHQIYTAGKVNGGNITWNMFEVDDIPQEGRGTAGSEQTYYVKKGDLTYILQCLNCSPRIFGDIAKPALSALGQILSTFKITH